MKKFLSNILGFFFIILLFNFVVFYLAKEIYFKTYQVQPSKKFNSFIFADSHGNCLYNYGELSNCYNFSASSDSYLDISRKLKYLIKNNYKVDRVFLSVDDHMLGHNRFINNNLKRSVYYLELSEVDNYPEYFYAKYLHYYLPIVNKKIRILASKFLISRFLFFFFHIKNLDNTNKWDQLTEFEKNTLSEKLKENSFTENNRHEELTKTFLEIINICKKRNIKLVGVKFPLSRNLIAAIGNTNYGADSILICSGFPVLNYKHVFSQNDDYFKDADHLNAIGGQILAEKLFNQY